MRAGPAFETTGVAKSWERLDAMLLSLLLMRDDDDRDKFIDELAALALN